MLKVGKKAPAFKLADQDGIVRQSKEFIGQWLLVYFYPKDDTPGCTKEACAITDVYKDFKRHKISVVGISKDSSKSHKKFATKYQLPFTLLADESTETIQKYGAWVEKSMYGKKYMGTSRISYLINPEGKIAKVYAEVDPASHALEILGDFKAIKKSLPK
jgi:thioredoxin-dependent peroxiredoxin